VWRVKAHDGLVRGLTVDTAGERVFSCSSDKTIKMWPLHRQALYEHEKDITPAATFLGQSAFLYVALCLSSPNQTTSNRVLTQSFVYII
jgi:hypothetical protein